MVEEDSITLLFADVQKQIGGNDCGILAIAFATAICLGELPGKFLFDRNHLIGCLEKQSFTMFPFKQERRQSSRKLASREIIPIYCVCRLPAINNVPMIQCSNCKRRFHDKHASRHKKTHGFRERSGCVPQSASRQNDFRSRSKITFPRFPFMFVFVFPSVHIIQQCRRSRGLARGFILDYLKYTLKK